MTTTEEQLSIQVEVPVEELTWLCEPLPKAQTVRVELQVGADQNIAAASSAAALSGLTKLRVCMENLETVRQASHTIFEDEVRPFL